MASEKVVERSSILCLLTSQVVVKNLEPVIFLSSLVFVQNMVE